LKDVYNGCEKNRILYASQVTVKSEFGL